MKITLCADDIVKRGLWDSYTYYIVGSEKESERLLLENTEFEISEKDAIVIGLLKVMETDNLIHRFNDYMVHFLTIKSNKEKDQLYIKKTSFELAIEKFMTKFPEYWNIPLNYKRGLDDLKDYIIKLNEKVSKLELIELTIQNNKYELYSSNAVKKLLTFNHY